MLLYSCTTIVCFHEQYCTSDPPPTAPYPLVPLTSLSSLYGSPLPASSFFSKSDETQPHPGGATPHPLPGPLRYNTTIYSKLLLQILTTTAIAAPKKWWCEGVKWPRCSWERPSGCCGGRDGRDSLEGTTATTANNFELLLLLRRGSANVRRGSATWDVLRASATWGALWSCATWGMLRSLQRESRFCNDVLHSWRLSAGGNPLWSKSIPCQLGHTWKLVIILARRDR